MKIIRDYDTSADKVLDLLEKLQLENTTENISVLDDPGNMLDIPETDSVLLITTMSSGFLKYHEEFFNKNKKKIVSLAVLLLNDDKTVYHQAESGFTSNGIRLEVFTISDTCTDFSSIAAGVKKLTKIKPKKILLYSKRPGCGKHSLCGLLNEFLPGWTIETTDVNNDLAESDASYIFILGNELLDFKTDIPANIFPYYILTMPDRNVQMYMNRKNVPEKLLEIIPEHLNWTVETTASHMFYISPLYESWRIKNTDPSLDVNFAMWDEFGLPITRSKYSITEIREFLSEFNDCEKLSGILKKQIDTK